ncbi:hypothetical protein JKF63_00278 [Porcisia hertigi]|uniref:Topoisomerase 6 subunit A/Spo11 TOPRIM domain-containing protein n=1 Tax=Porcisia hertigi TaxID=2761500 RepID=A0A836KX00_9TRYP|nr:hypothetical protein JKF63_00278 [Porcisia hertigi]
MSTAPIFQDPHCAPYSQQLQSHFESLLLLFLRNFCAEGANPTGSGYRASHLQTIAQTFYVMQIVLCGAALQRGQGTSNSLLATSEATANLSVCTERDLYYRNPPLFAPQGQRAAHASVERLCSWLEVMARVPREQRADESVLASLFRNPHSLLLRLLKGTRGAASRIPLYTRESLGITAAGKSLLVGALMLEMCDPFELIDVSARGSVGITLTHSLAARMVGCRESGCWRAARDGGPSSHSCKLVLIEKESTHHALIQSMVKSDAHHMHSHVLLCTKGYPCVAARHWLRRAHALWPALQLYVMVDGDPHGLCIALTLMGLLGSKGSPAPATSLEPKPTRPSSPPGPTPASAATAKVKELLPLRFLGVCPSLLWGRNLHSSAPLSADPFSGPTSSEGTPLTADDVQVLKRISATVQATLASTSETSDSATRPQRCDTAIVRHTLQHILREAEWMQRSQIKCELQLACCPLGPLTFMKHHVQRCDAELSEVR